MRIHIHYRDTQTGITGEVSQDWPGDTNDPGDLVGLRYYFGEGNFGCDDNRSYDLMRGSGGKYDEELDCNRPNKNRIAIDKITDDDGKILYRDEDRDSGEY